MRGGEAFNLFLLGACVACGGGRSPIGSSIEHKGDVAAVTPDTAAAGQASSGDEPAAAADAGPPPEPPPDPALVRALVAKTGENTPVDNPLHVRLELMPRPAFERWLIAVVNRGTEPVSVLLDLRYLTLELETPEDAGKPRPKWKKKPAPLLCKLPEGFGGQLAVPEEPRRLEPGEGLVRTFDPRLYCISSTGESLLSTGQTVTAKLGLAPKAPRVVYRQGKRTEVPSVQSAPFVAEPVAVIEPGTLPAATPAPDAETDTQPERRVKQLAASPFELSSDLLGGEGEEDTTQPLSLRLLRGSDVPAERTATASMEVRARTKATVYFRRELVSFTVHGPEGIRACDPQPDERSPDRQAYSTLSPGQAISATSMLAELCPNLTFGRPGLYLLSARFDAERDGSEFGLRAFTGRLESRRQAWLRIRTGDLPALPPAEPLRIRVGE